ncbi:MAG: hypothetical protein ACKERG_04355, partial [Candidatus Hodgkinia cicadicola]
DRILGECTCVIYWEQVVLMAQKLPYARRRSWRLKKSNAEDMNEALMQKRMFVDCGVLASVLADYGFNKSYAAVCSTLAYVTVHLSTSFSP